MNTQKFINNDEILSILPIENQRSIVATNIDFNEWTSKQLRREIDRIIQTQVNDGHLNPHLKGGKVMELVPEAPEGDDNKDDAGDEEDDYGNGHDDDGWYDYDEMVMNIGRMAMRWNTRTVTE